MSAEIVSTGERGRGSFDDPQKDSLKGAVCGLKMMAMRLTRGAICLSVSSENYESLEKSVEAFHTTSLDFSRAQTDEDAAAKAIGHEIPSGLLLRADKVIE